MSEAQTSQFAPITPIRVDMQLDLYGLNPYEFRIYAHIARRKQCYSNLKTMAAICNMSVRQAQYALKGLLEKNLISQEKRRGKTNVYKITDEDAWEKPDRSITLRSGLEYYNRALIKRELGDQLGAIQDFRRSIELFEKELKDIGGNSTRKEKDLKDAQKEFQKEIDKEPKK